MARTTTTMTTTAAEGELERLRQAQREAEAGLEDAQASRLAAGLHLSEADELATAVVLGEADADGVARRRAAALDRQQRAEAEIHRLEQVREGLAARIRAAEQAVRVERVDELCARRAAAVEERADAERLLAEALAEAPALPPAVEAALALRDTRARIRELDRDVDEAAAAAAVEPTLGEDEAQWRPEEGWQAWLEPFEALIDVVGSGPATPNADRARAEEVLRSARQAAEDKLVAEVVRKVAFEPGGYDRDAFEATLLAQLPVHLRAEAHERALRLRAERQADFDRRHAAATGAEEPTIFALPDFGETMTVAEAAERAAEQTAQRGAAERERLDASNAAWTQARTADRDRRRAKLAAGTGEPEAEQQPKPGAVEAATVEAGAV